MYKRSKPLAQNANDILGGSKYTFTDIKPQNAEKRGSKVNVTDTSYERGTSKKAAGIYDKGFGNDSLNPY